METDVRLETWSDGDFGLLRRNNAPEMTEHLGGPESEEQLTARHQRYLNIETTGTGRMFRIVLAETGEAVGAIGYWERVWQGETVYETGWGVLPEFQGRGIAVAAARAVAEHAGAAGMHRYLHAFPSVGHAASNAVCRKAGFELVGACTFEYPKGHFMESNDWRMALTPH
ncbi:GNAT family N-acetyltransferase [Streptomyces sp. A3M-1-3]|uniref:GNAT family N-acetyltransferase n=1 Tax=Streptomyces sp. A3M-1-3 TaxID=2962044 RepID=UPI0020B894AE|nr:GNAT family N-acetyltransferase [Streptomyces sp. A3M-1-3]MCP3822088.1 GNAT family N-acetyltransferase [Streptomyces sp. A3M-1-3]